MNFSIKPIVFLIAFLPGFLFIFCLIIVYKNYDFAQIIHFTNNISLFWGVSLLSLAFIIGQVFDSVRDISEKDDLNWDFFFEGKTEDIDKIDNYYFLFYVLYKNLIITMFVLIPIIIINFFLPLKELFEKSWIIQPKPVTLILIFLVSIYILRKDANVLRNDIKRHIRKKS